MKTDLDHPIPKLTATKPPKSKLPAGHRTGWQNMIGTHRAISAGLLGVVAALTSATQMVNAAGAPTFTTLEPGKTRVIGQEISINIVLVGYEEGAGARDINTAALLARRHLTTKFSPPQPRPALRSSRGRIPPTTSRTAGASG